MKTLVKSLFLRPQRTLDLEYQDGGDELQNLITEITEMRDLGLFISVHQRYVSHAMRPGLKHAVKCILRNGSAHNKGGSFRYKHGLNFASFGVFVD